MYKELLLTDEEIRPFVRILKNYYGDIRVDEVNVDIPCLCVAQVTKCKKAIEQEKQNIEQRAIKAFCENCCRNNDDCPATSEIHCWELEEFIKSLKEETNVKTD